MNEKNWISWKIQTSKTWSDMEDILLYTNIDFIDFDHKTLVEYALELNQLISRTEVDFSIESLQEIGHLLNRLYSYAKEHFEREEIFMSKYNLPEIESHKIEHKRIVKMLMDSIDDFNRGKIKVSHKLKIQVMDWLIQHINGTDNEFFDVKNWSDNLVNASDWMEVRDIIRLTGISDIDEQHKRLTEIAIEIMCDINEDTQGDIIKKMFYEFKAYVIYHFSYEASFMHKFGISDTKDHIAEHNYFLRKLDEFPQDLIEDISKLEEMKKWTLTWWIKHINITDRETFDYKRWASKAIENAQSIDDVNIILRYTNLDTVDNDHVELMKATFQLNMLISLNGNNNGITFDESAKEEIIHKFKEIYEIAEKHFKREEKIMIRHQFVDYKSHAAEHQLVLDRIKLMLKNYEEDRLYVSTNIKNMILDWWLNHTNNVDYRSFVSNIGESLRKIIIKEESLDE